MKFGFIVTNLTGGGAEKAILKISVGLMERGHEVHVVLLENIVEHAVPPGLSVHALTRSGGRLSKGILGKYIAAIRLRWTMRRLAKAKPFDITISTLPFADEVAALAKLPRHWCRIANTLSVEVARLKKTSPAKAARRLERYQRLYGSRPLIAVSEGVAEDLRSELGLTDTRVECIYNPFDFLAIRAQAKESASLPKDPFVIHVGRFSAQKRHDLLLDAWAQVKEPHRLVLLAEPAAALQAMIDARGLRERVIVAGFQRNPYPWIAGADLLVLSSDHEGLPNVIIEAVALGTPVVSTDCPSGPRQILGNAYPGCLVPVNDAAALAKAITQVLGDRPNLDQIVLSFYTTDAVIAAYERLASNISGFANDRN